jgi:hypothetical protein
MAFAGQRAAATLSFATKPHQDLVTDYGKPKNRRRGETSTAGPLEDGRASRAPCGLRQLHRQLQFTVNWTGPHEACEEGSISFRFDIKRDTLDLRVSTRASNVDRFVD